jgi:hypothetical protein
MFALMAAGPASASAFTPEFLHGGEPLSEEVPFTLTSSALTWETVGGEKVTCTSPTAKGTVINSTEQRLVLDLQGCKGPLGVACTTQGKSTGEIVTKNLKGTLHYGVKSEEVLNELAPVEGNVFAEFQCIGVGYKWTGSVLGLVTPLFSEQTTETWTFAQSGGKQIPSEYENGEGELIQAYLQESRGGGAPEQMGFNATASITFASAIEVCC